MARVSCSNSLAIMQEMTAIIQYVLTSAQLFGSQDYYNKSLMMMILGLAGVIFCKMSRHGQNELSFVPKIILTWMPREARGGLKATAGKRQQPYYHFSQTVFVTLCFFQPECCFPARLCSKPFQHIDIVGLSHVEL